MGDDRERRPGAFFGRRKGKTLRAAPRALMTGALDALTIDLDRAGAPAALFEQPVRDIHLEIGFGGGEHLAARAAQSPEIGFIGCEAFVNGIAKLLGLIGAAGLANIRIHPDDAARLIERLPHASIGRIYILYPDPWPKRRHRKRRFLSEAMIGRLADILKPGGELRFATDIDDYSAFVLARMARSGRFDWMAGRPADWLTPWPGWPGTRYEAKALREGRRPVYLSFRRRAPDQT